MADNLEQTGERVYDPDLDEERDAFPGEILPEEQQKTLQKLMEEGRRQFRAIYEDIEDQLTPEEIRAIVKAGEIKAEKKRQEYLEGINSNPGNLLAELLKGINVNVEQRGINILLEGLDSKIVSTAQRIDEQAKADKLAGKPIKSIGEYAQEGITEVIQLASWTPIQSVSTAAQVPAFAILKTGQFVPPEIDSFRDFINGLARARNTPSSGRPYFTSSLFTSFVNNITSTKPGLEGVVIQMQVESSDFGLREFKIFGSAEACRRIFTKGQYTPLKRDSVGQVIRNP